MSCRSWVIFIQASVSLTANDLAMKNGGPKITEPFFSDSTVADRFYFILSGIVCKGINTLLKITIVDALVETNSFRTKVGITSGYKAPRVSIRFLCYFLFFIKCIAIIFLFLLFFCHFHL